MMLINKFEPESPEWNPDVSKYPAHICIPLDMDYREECFKIYDVKKYLQGEQAPTAWTWFRERQNNVIVACFCFKNIEDAVHFKLVWA